jgi:hypothetical protein
MSEESMYRESSSSPARLPCIVQINDSLYPGDALAYVKSTPLTDKEARLFEKLQEYPAVDDFYGNYAFYLQTYCACARDEKITTESIMRSATLQHAHLTKLHSKKQTGMDLFFPLQDYKDCVLDLVTNFRELKWSVCTDRRAIVKFSWKGNHHVIVLPIPY